MANWVGACESAAETPCGEGTFEAERVLVEFEVEGFLKDSVPPGPTGDDE